VLRSGVGEEDVDEFADNLGYPRRVDTPADEESWTPRTVIWHGNSGATVAYREDIYSGLPYMILMASDDEELRAYVELAEIVLRTWRLAELLHEVDAAGGSEDRADAVVQLGLGAPREFDAEVFGRIVAGMHSGDEEVLEASLMALTYEPWAQYAKPVRELLADGLSGELADSARSILEMFESDRVISDA
jgi:hypothetical protein